MGEEIIDPTNEVTRVIDDEIFKAKGEPLDPKALERIRKTVSDVNQKIQTENKFSYENGDLKFGDTVIKLTKYVNGEPVKGKDGKFETQSYTERISDLVKFLEDKSIADEGKNDIKDTTDPIAQEIGEQIGLKGDALAKFTDAKSEALKQSLQPVLDAIGSQPQSSQAASAAVSEVVEKTGLSEANAEQVAPKPPQTAAELIDRAKNPKGIDKVIIDTFTKQVGEKAMKEIQDKVDKINNDTKLSDEEKEAALKKIGDDAVKTIVDNAASQTWGEKISKFWEGLKDVMSALGGFIKFAAYLIPAILLIVFSYNFVDQWAKGYTGCFMEFNDQSKNLKKTYKVKGLTCSNNYRNEMKNFEDYPDYTKECSTIMPTPPPPDGCKPCNEGIKDGTDNCPCPDNSDSRAVYASKWCDNKYLKSPDASFSHNYYKRYCSWMDAFTEIGTMIFDFIPGLLNTAPNPGSFLDKLFQLLEGLGILALIFVGIYGLLWMAKSFGFLGGGKDKGGDGGTTVIIQEEEHKHETSKDVPKEAPQIAPKQVAQEEPEATCATDYSKCKTRQELIAITPPPERMDEWSKALEQITVSGSDYATQQAKVSEDRARAEAAKVSALALKQREAEASAVKKQSEDAARQQREAEAAAVKKQAEDTARQQQEAEAAHKSKQEDIKRQTEQAQALSLKVQAEGKLAEEQAKATEAKRKLAEEQAKAIQKQIKQEALSKLQDSEKIARSKRLQQPVAQPQQPVAQQYSSSSSSSLFTTPSPGGEQIPSSIAIQKGAIGRGLSSAESPEGTPRVRPAEASFSSDWEDEDEDRPLFGQQSLQRRFRARKSIRASRRMIK